MPTKRTPNRSRLSEDWTPDHDATLFAGGLGVSAELEAGKFRDYHVANGSLMASWPAAWRLWCRNAAKFDRIKKPAPPLIEGHGPTDPWGIVAWAHNLPDTEADTLNGAPILTLCGMDVIGTARDVLKATGWPGDAPVDLSPIGDWLRDGIDPDILVESIATSGSRPDRCNLRYWDKRIRQKAQSDR